MNKDENQESAQGAETSSQKESRVKAEKALSEGKDPGQDSDVANSGTHTLKSGKPAGPMDLSTGERVKEVNKETTIQSVPEKTREVLENERQHQINEQKRDEPSGNVPNPADGQPGGESSKAKVESAKEGKAEYNPEKDKNKAKTAKKIASSVNETTDPEEAAKMKKDFAAAVVGMIEESSKVKTLTVPHSLGVHVLNHQGAQFDPDSKKLKVGDHTVDVVFDDDVEKFELK